MRRFEIGKTYKLVANGTTQNVQVLRRLRSVITVVLQDRKTKPKHIVPVYAQDGTEYAFPLGKPKFGKKAPRIVA